MTQQARSERRTQDRVVALFTNSERPDWFGYWYLDPVTLGLAVALLLVCEGLGLVVPVRRAARVNPISALR